MPHYPGRDMGGVPMSVGDGLSWAWSKFKDNALILVAGIGVWSILSLLGGFNFHVTLNGQEYGVGFGVPFGFPAFIVLFLFFYSVYFTVDKGVDGIAGMGASWNILSSHVGELLPFALTGAGLYIVGGITVFGWLVTVPLAVLMTGYSYVRIQGYDVVR